MIDFPFNDIDRLEQEEDDLPSIPTFPSIFQSQQVTPNEREEFIFDLAHHRVDQLSHAGIFAMAVDQMCSLLANESEERLMEIAPSNLFKKDKKKHEKAKGF